MANKLTVAKFNYEQIEDKEVRGKLIYGEGQVAKLKASVANSVLALGEQLCEIRDVVAKQHSRIFLEWVESCGIGRSSAYRYMAAWEKFGKLPNLGSFEDSAMYLLSQENTPPQAFDEAQVLAKRGVQVTLTIAKELAEKHKTKPPRLAAPKVEDAEFTVVASAPEAASEETGKDDSTEAQATEEAQETAPRPTRSVKERKPAPGDVPKDLGKCPVCAGTKFDDRSGTGLACSKCHHPHGCETGGDRDENDDKRASDQKAKTRKTIEALMRAYDDLAVMLPKPREHADAIATCKSLLNKLKTWN